MFPPLSHSLAIPCFGIKLTFVWILFSIWNFSRKQLLYFYRDTCIDAYGECARSFTVFPQRTKVSAAVKRECFIDVEMKIGCVVYSHTSFKIYTCNKIWWWEYVRNGFRWWSCEASMQIKWAPLTMFNLAILKRATFLLSYRLEYVANEIKQSHNCQNSTVSCIFKNTCRFGRPNLNQTIKSTHELTATTKANGNRGKNISLTNIMKWKKCIEMKVFIFQSDCRLYVDL